MSAVASIMRAQALLLARLNQILEPFGLTFARYSTLMILSFSRTGAMPLSKLGERLQVHPTSVTNIIDRLEADGLVRRVPHGKDRRATLARITASARRLATEATELLNEASFSTLPLTRAELDELTRIIRKFRRAAGDFVD